LGIRFALSHNPLVPSIKLKKENKKRESGEAQDEFQTTPSISHINFLYLTFFFPKESKGDSKDEKTGV